MSNEQQKEAVNRIIEYWNRGEKEKARNYFKLSGWVLPQSTKEYLTAVLYEKPNPKTIEFLKEACKIFGGGRIFFKDQLIYDYAADSN